MSVANSLRQMHEAAARWLFETEVNEARPMIEEKANDIERQFHAHCHRGGPEESGGASIRKEAVQQGDGKDDRGESQ